jgi:hypothetical protein
MLGPFMPRNLDAQTGWQATDSITYRYYLDKAWKNVLTEVNQSLKQGVDFYYLRVRAGIAAYQLKKYRLAAHHLAQCYQWNNNDPFVNYWYYLSLVMSGNTDEANYLSAQFTQEFLQQEQIIPSKAIHNISAEYQLTGNNRFQELSNQVIVDDNSYLNYRSLMKQQRYYGLGMDHALGDRLNLFHQFGHLRVDRTELIQSDYPQLRQTKEQYSLQYNYYLNGRYLLGQGWSAFASLSLLWGDSFSHWVTFTSNPTPVVTKYSYNINDRVFNAGIAKDFWWVRPELSFAFGNINGLQQFQATPGFTLYPLGNANFYLSSEMSLHKGEEENGVKSVFSQKIGVKTGPVWLIADGRIGTIKNFSAGRGYVVYNMPEQINRMAGISVFVPLFEYKMELLLRYMVTEKQGLDYHYQPDFSYFTTPYEFYDTNLLISLKWNL